MLSGLAITLFLFVLPGSALLHIIFPKRAFSLCEWIGLSAGLSLALYPLLSLGLYVIGVAPGSLLAWLPGSISACFCFWRLYFSHNRQKKASPIRFPLHFSYHDGFAFIVLLALAYVRLMSVHQMVAPAWGDSVHHTTIVQLILDHGGLFQSWAPYAPMRTFTYHFGYHVAIACWSWISGMSAPQSVIVGSQMINLLAVVALYPLAVKLARGNHYAGVGTLIVAGFFTQLPAFYVNWGRYTQLTSQVILPVFIWLLDGLLLKKEAPKVAQWLSLALVSIGLTLTHYRVSVIAASAALAWCIWGLWHYRNETLALVRRVLGLVVVAVVTLLAILPWLLIIRSGRLLLMTGAISSRTTDAAVNISELTVWQSLDTYYPYFLWQVAIIVLFLSLWKQPDFSVKFGLWSAFSFLAASPFLIGLPGTGLVTNFLLIVGVYIVIAIAIGWAWGWVSLAMLKAKSGRWLWGGICLGLLCLGGFSQRHIVEPFYQLVDKNDLRTFAWIRENVPPDTRFLVNGFLAYGDKLVVGSDAGWWLPLFTKREATIPPILYTAEAITPEIDRTFYRQLVLDLTESNGVPEKLRQILCLAKITHVFLGEKQGQGGFGATALVPVEWLQSNSDFVLLHQENLAQVWQFDRTQCANASTEEHMALSDFETNQAIWVNQEVPEHPQVVFFRKPFTTSIKLHESQLRIFADTRYEVWLDGVRIGRGPARFSKTRHEYDLLSLGEIQAGNHLLAVLVQWAPNTRRSESTTPHLMADIQGKNDDLQLQTVVKSSPDWKTLRSDAWREDAVPVHSWNLLGPTELLDLRRLPAKWIQFDYSDDSWQYAVGVNLPHEIIYAPRSIPLLVETIAPATVLDFGLFSSERTIVQLPPQTSAFSLPFQLLAPATVTIESLRDLDSQQPLSAKIDGTTVNWVPLDEKRPDLLAANLDLSPAWHTLSFESIPLATGMTFAISRKNVAPIQSSFEQSNHAGRRLLLAEPYSHQESIVVSQDTANATFDLLIKETPAYIVFDLGRVSLGRLHASVKGASGTVVDIGWDERLYPGTLRPLPHPGSLHKEWNQVDSWILDGNERRLTTLDARAGRYILLAVWGAVPVEIHSLRFAEELYPVQQIGRFQSSDPLLNRIWKIGVNSARISMQDAYADAWRERGQWWGDAYVANHVNQVVFGDTHLLHRGLVFLAESFKNGQPLAFAPNGDGSQLVDYSMLWAQSLADYLRLSADKHGVTKLYPRLEELLSFLNLSRNQETGLLDIPKGHWSQTALIDWAGAKSRNGQSTALNALYYKTLLDSAEIAAQINKELTATQLRQDAAQLRQSINTYLYQPSKYLYYSSIVDGKYVTPTTHAQAWPLALGVTEKSEINGTANSLLQSFHVEIFGMYWALEGLASSHRIDAAIELIREKYGRLVELGATTWWEGWSDSMNYRGALSHGWGASPTWFLSTHLLGAQHINTNRWVIAPAFSGVEWVDGVIPFQNSELSVMWQVDNCSKMSLLIDAPYNTSGIVRLPFPAISRLEVDEQVIWQGGKSVSDFQLQFIDNEILFQLDEGQHSILIERFCNFLPAILVSQ